MMNHILAGFKHRMRKYQLLNTEDDVNCKNVLLSIASSNTILG